jgi:hypothetical protein
LTRASLRPSGSRRQRIEGIPASARVGDCFCRSRQVRCSRPCSAETRRAAGDLALGCSVFFARGIGELLCLAPACPRLDLGGRGRRARRFGGFERAHVILHFGARRRQFGLDRSQPAALGEPPRRAGRCMRRGGKAVPAPVVAFARDEPLTRLEQGRQAWPVAALDNADLRKPPRQLGRRPHKAVKAARACGQNRSAGSIARPAHRC